MTPQGYRTRAGREAAFGDEDLSQIGGIRDAWGTGIKRAANVALPCGLGKMRLHTGVGMHFVGLRWASH